MATQGSNNTTCDAIVLGAGPAGLATALEAAERGLDVVLVERQANVGGMAASFTVDGLRVDHGSHRLHPVTPAPIMNRLQQLLGSDLQTRPRHGRLRLINQWVDFPLHPGNLARSMPPRWVASVALDTTSHGLRTSWQHLRRAAHRASAAPRTGDPDAEGGSEQSSYASALRASLGPTVYDTLYGPFARKLWGLSGAEIDAEQARVRVSADTVAKVAARVVSPGTSRGATFLYPRRGFGQITDALEAAATAAGADLHTGTAVASIAPADPVSGLAEVISEGGTRWQAPRIFSTLPIPLLAQLSAVEVPVEVRADARALRYRAMVLVYLTHTPQARVDGAASTRARWSGFDAHYLPAGDTPVTRISEPANYRDSPDDPVDRTVLCAEIPCAAGDLIWNADDEELAAIVQHALAGASLPPAHGPAGSPPAVHVRRLSAVYPIYEHGFAQRLERLEQWAQSQAGITTLGRSGLFAHDNTHHALLMARAAVAALGPDGIFDDTAWRRARESFRDHVVQD